MKEKNTRKKNLNVIIRQMEIDDLPEVFALGEKIFTSKSPTLYRTWDEYELTEFFLSDSDLCLVAELNEKIVGFLLGTTLSKHKNPWTYGNLTWLGVDNRYRKIGIANKLFNHFIDLMVKKGVRIIVTDTEADNKLALEFFKKKGFGKIRKHLYFSLNLDAMLKKKKRKK